jgi:alpha-beta hydrolase superfamily lysophospholipase
VAATQAETLNKFASLAVHPREIIFAGDNVRLAGQIDYPRTPPVNGTSYPLMVVLHHAGGNTRVDYHHYAQVALECGYAVFRWDKRGTGSSGASGLGSALKDAVAAYAIALKQPNIDQTHTVILAQGEGTLLFSEGFAEFEAVQPVFGALLIGNMLDAREILNIKTRIQIMHGAKDWLNWEVYGKTACNSHRRAYTYGAQFTVAHHADRMLFDIRKPGMRFHIGAKQIIKDWLNELVKLPR